MHTLGARGACFPCTRPIRCTRMSQGYKPRTAVQESFLCVFELRGQVSRRLHLVCTCACTEYFARTHLPSVTSFRARDVVLFSCVSGRPAIHCDGRVDPLRGTRPGELTVTFVHVLVYNAHTRCDGTLHSWYEMQCFPRVSQLYPLSTARVKLFPGMFKTKSLQVS